MLTGARLFAGETVTDVLASVVQRDPDLSRVPPNVQRLLRRCLEKDVKKRVRDASDAMLLLESAGDPLVQVPSQRWLLLARSARCRYARRTDVAILHPLSRDTAGCANLAISGGDAGQCAVHAVWRRHDFA